MKKNYLFLSMLVTGLMIFAIAISSCTKEGPAGAPGKDGEDGIDGQDGTATCIECHDNSQDIFAKVNQWEASTHATGGNFERNGTSCAPCHTSQGFLERMAAGTMETGAAISNPNPPNCYTCHNIHDTYTTDDWALTYTDPVELWNSGAGARATIDLGTGNLCGNCHQSRVVDPFPVDGQNYEITNRRYGPHHGPVANMIAGMGGYEYPGQSYGNSMHTNLVTNSCTTCHMAEAYGTQSGGHQMGASYEYHGSVELNVAGCTECHPDEDGLITLVEETQEEINGLLADLKTAMMNGGILTEDDYVMGADGENYASSSNPANLTADQLGAIVNYQTVREDRSAGVHNYLYAKALLQTSIDALSN